jgi:hypothetical protein
MPKNIPAIYRDLGAIATKNARIKRDRMISTGTALSLPANPLLALHSHRENSIRHGNLYAARNSREFIFRIAMLA